MSASGTDWFPVTSIAPSRCSGPRSTVKVSTISPLRSSRTYRACRRSIALLPQIRFDVSTGILEQIEVDAALLPDRHQRVAAARGQRIAGKDDADARPALDYDRQAGRRLEIGETRRDVDARLVVAEIAQVLFEFGDARRQRHAIVRAAALQPQRRNDLGLAGAAVTRDGHVANQRARPGVDRERQRDQLRRASGNDAGLNRRLAIAAVGIEAGDGLHDGVELAIWAATRRPDR